MQEMLNPLATYSTAHTSRQKTWKERKQSTKNKVSRANKLHIKMFIGSGYQEDERSDPVVKCTNPRLGVGGCTPWSSPRHKALESSKIMEHFELWVGSGQGRWVVGECQSNMDKLQGGTTQNPTAGVIFSLFLNTIYIYLLHWQWVNLAGQEK